MRQGGYRSLQIKGQRGRRPSANPKQHRVAIFLDAAAYAELARLAALPRSRWTPEGITPGRKAGEMLTARLRVLAARHAESVNLES